MHGQGAGGDLLLGGGGGEQPFGQRGLFGVGDRPADDRAAEHVQDHVQVVVGPRRWAEQPGDIPAPQLVGPGRQQLRSGMTGMGELVAPLAGLPGLGQDPVHGAFGGEVGALVQQGGDHFRWGDVDEPGRVEQVTDGLALRVV
jgi:hypothetical protein